MNKRAVIFDLDGTLAPTMDAIQGYFIQRVEELTKRQITQSEFGQAFHYDLATFLHNLGVTDSSHAHKLELELRQLEAKQSKSEFFDGLKELLEQLHKAEYDLYLWTLRYQQSTLEILKHNQVHHYFIDHHCGDHHHPKPHNFGMKEKLICNYQQLFMVGDTVTDILGGKNIGATTIGVTWSKTNTKEMLVNVGADFIFETVSGLKNFFHK